MGLFGKKTPPDCIYCGKQCYTQALTIRFDKATILATCPKGKAFDNMCEAIAEALHYAAYRGGRFPDEKKKDKGPEERGGWFGGTDNE